MDFLLLVIFHEVYWSRRSTAAERLGLSQSAVSPSA